MKRTFALVDCLTQALGLLQSDDPARLLEINRGFVALRSLFDEILIESRGSQTRDERLLQSQFFSRIAFISSQIRDLDITAHRQIVEHGVSIGNTAAECIVQAETELQLLAEETGSELMEISAIARRDFLRIPNEFVHPTLERTEQLSQGFLNEVMTRMSSTNIVFDTREVIGQLEAQLDSVRAMLPTVQEEISSEVIYMRTQMNYVKAEVFPIMEYTLRYFRDGSERIIASLSNCN